MDVISLDDFSNVFFVNNDLVNNVYSQNDNYLIKKSNSVGKCCAIYFSSNGIYYPDTEESFEKTIIKNNRYEWFGTTVKRASKHIFLRDVHKEWYLKGINSRINTQKKLLDFLESEIIGYEEVITVGSSAGAYAAILFGCLLNAKTVIAFSPQYNLKLLLEQKRYPYIHEFIARGEEEWLDLDNIVKKSKSDIFYFYPERALVDIPHYNSIIYKEKIKFIYISSCLHGAMSLLKPSIIKVLNSDNIILSRYADKHVKSMDRLILGFVPYYLAVFVSMIKKNVKKARKCFCAVI